MLLTAESGQLRPSSAEVSGGKGRGDVGGERTLGKSIDICFVSTNKSLSTCALYGRAANIQKGITMKFLRRQFLQLAGAAAAAPVFPQLASALDYPIGPVKVIVGFAAGGGADIMARLIGPLLSERLGQQFVVENRTGAGSNIAAEAVVRATPDGYTLLIATAANAINATLYEKLNFNILGDVAPVAGIMVVPHIMVVNPLFSAKSVPEFIAYAKANPGKITFASAGVGSTPHVSRELFNMMAGVNMRHVPYRGGAPAIDDLLGGHVDVMFESMSSTIGHVRGGTLRALAVTTAKRSEALPNVATVSEFAPGYDTTFWGGIAAPKNTPAEIIDKLNKETNAILSDPRVKAQLAEQGGTALAGSPADFGKLIAADTEKWGKVVKFAGLKAD
jgi:tripartite-type tricarboxylate transporter receptor subunit TctC